MNVAAVVLAAGGSRRLGRPKQLLDYRGATLLDATLATARAVGPARWWWRWAGAADEVRERVDLTGVDVVLNPDFGDGCATSIRSGAGGRARRRGRRRTPPRRPARRRRPGRSRPWWPARAAHAVGVCEYDDGLGHPLWFDRRMFDVLAGLHGDKAVWKLVDAGEDVVRVPVAGRIPRDVDTWADYQALLEAAE